MDCEEKPILNRCPVKLSRISRRVANSASHNVRRLKSTSGSSSSVAIALWGRLSAPVSFRTWPSRNRPCAETRPPKSFTGSRKSNELQKLAEMVKDDPLSRKTDWDAFLNALLHDFAYPNYLFSLPMGAGKTYLMAAFIYLDLHFARLHPNDPRFARNFVVFAPQASKTAILPSLQTIRNFDPSWVLPAERCRRTPPPCAFRDSGQPGFQTPRQTPRQQPQPGAGQSPRANPRLWACVHH